TVPLICAGAEALPFPDDAFDRVVADAVLEHVWEQHVSLAECHRVLQPGGYVFLTTPNRFSLGPDPHVGLWAGGYLPNRWIDAYVLRQGGNPPHRQLLSSGRFRQLCRSAGFRVCRLYLPDIAAGQRDHCGGVMKGLISLYQLAKRWPVSRSFLYYMGPNWHAGAEKTSAVQ